MIARLDSEADSDYMSGPTSMDDVHSEASSEGSPAVEGDSGCNPDVDQSLSCDRIATIQGTDMAVMVQVTKDVFSVT